MCDTVALLGEPKSHEYFNAIEGASLHALRRGVFAAVDIPQGKEIGRETVSFRFPLRDGQIDVPDFTTIYHRFTSSRSIRAGEPITRANAQIDVDSRARNLDRFVQRTRGIASEAGIDIADDEYFELSHHHGVDQIWQYGCCIVNVLNRAYCKKLIIMTGGQEHPEQFHAIKEETFRIVRGELQVTLDGQTLILRQGQSLVVEPNVKHHFKALTDTVVEELSTTSLAEDTVYTDPQISSIPRTSRKTIVRNFMRSD
jgi:quercetin dioxygenase-like cupin family protein